MNEVPQKQSQNNDSTQYFAEKRMNDAFMSIFGVAETKPQTQERKNKDEKKSSN